MKKTVTFLLLLVAAATMQAQTSIPLTNGDCSTDATLSGASPYVISGFTIAAVSPAVLTTASCGVTGGKLKIVGTTNGVQGNLTITTDKVDISSYPSDATFTYACKLVCGTATSQAQPYNVIVIAYAADGITVVTTNTLTLTKLQPNTNVTAGTVLTVGATLVMKLNAVTPGLDAKYISFQLQMGKMITNNLTFDDFTLSNLSAPPTTVVGTPSNAALTYEVGNGPSTESTFTVSGTDLSTTDVTLTPGTNMEISLISGVGGTWVGNPSTIALTPTAGTVPSTTIYTRLKSGINGLGAVGASSARVTVVHSTAGTKTVQFTGSITGIVVTKPTSDSLLYVPGAGPSAERTYNVSGNVTSDIVLTPGSNVEISTTSGSSFASAPITLTQSAGAVVLTPIYARLIAGLPAATYNDATTKVIASSAGMTSKEVQFVGIVDISVGVLSKTISNMKFSTIDGAIHVTGVAAGIKIEVYSSVGQQVKSIVATGYNSIALPSKGMYLVKVGSLVQKVVLK
jgi:hypothetical protein